MGKGRKRKGQDQRGEQEPNEAQAKDIDQLRGSLESILSGLGQYAVVLNKHFISTLALSILTTEELQEFGVPKGPAISIAAYHGNHAGSSQVKPNKNLRQFWKALEAAEIEEKAIGTLEDGTKHIIKILTLPSSAFPGETEESKRRLLVRQCYEELADMMLAHFQQGGWVFVLNGNPGIGKSLFSFYFMWRLAKMGGQTIVWEQKNAEKDRYLISPHGVFGGSMQDFSDVLADKDTWYLVDGKSPKDNDARTILVSSPDHEIIKEAVKWPAKLWRWMPVWSWEDIRAAGVHIFGQQESDVRDRYERWLGVPRYVLQQLGEADQNSLEEAIDQCSLEALAQSYTSLTAHKQFSHKLVHVQVKEGYLKGHAQIAGGYIEDRLIARYVRAKDSDVERFLAASGYNADARAFTDIIFEKKKTHKILEEGGSFRCRDLSSDAADQPAQSVPFPMCSRRQVVKNPDAIRDLPDGVYGYPGSSNWDFAGIDAVVQPDLLYQIAVSQKHGINTHGLVAAANNLRCGAANVKLVFAVPPTAFSHNHGSQLATAIRNRPELTSLARSVKQYMMEIPIQRYARSETAAAGPWD